MDGCLICGARHIGACSPDHPAHRPLSAEQWAEREARGQALAAEGADRAAPGEVMGADRERDAPPARGEEHAGRAALAYVREHYEAVAAQVAALEDPARRAEAERHLRAIREEAAGRAPSLSRGQAQEVELER